MQPNNGPHDIKSQAHPVFIQAAGLVGLVKPVKEAVELMRGAVEAESNGLCGDDE